MAVFLITYEGGDRNAAFQIVWLNVSNMNVKTGDSTRFTRIGVVRRNMTQQQVLREATRGVQRQNAVVVRRLGPVTIDSDAEHLHWRMVALRVFRMQPTAGEERVFAQMRANGDL